MEREECTWFVNLKRAEPADEDPEVILLSFECPPTEGVVFELAVPKALADVLEDGETIRLTVGMKGARRARLLVRRGGGDGDGGRGA